VAKEPFSERHPLIWKSTYPVRHPIKATVATTYPVRHPLATGKWMEGSGFNGGLCGAGAFGQILYATRSFWIH
jgi:hypothetical protein